MTPTITPEEAERALSVVDDHMSTPEGYALALSTLRSFISQYKAQATRIETLEEALRPLVDFYTQPKNAAQVAAEKGIPVFEGMEEKKRLVDELWARASNALAGGE